MSEGIKHDAGKPATDLLPFDAIEDVARVLEYGRKKYSARNWELGMAWGRLLGASLRHLFAWARGVEIDEESGLPHLAHASCSVLMLAALVKRRVGTDDRLFEQPHNLMASAPDEPAIMCSKCGLRPRGAANALCRTCFGDGTDRRADHPLGAFGVATDEGQKSPHWRPPMPRDVPASFLGYCEKCNAVWRTEHLYRAEVSSLEYPAGLACPECGRSLVTPSDGVLRKFDAIVSSRAESRPLKVKPAADLEDP